MTGKLSGILAIWSVIVSGGGAWAQEALPLPTPVQSGVEVLARGPVHEAFATPSVEPAPTQPVPKKPPAPIEELPPEERPQGDAVWVPGYWAWDDDRQDFLWVSGCWRIQPAGKEWVPGYWREVGNQWQWLPGFWAAVQQNQAPEVTYYPEPPALPALADPGPAPGPDMFQVPGYWMWMGDRYAWRAGYWTQVRPGYVYVASHYRWTPYGCVFVPGYWDLAVARRGLLYAPVIVNPNVVTATFVYTPSYAVTDTIVLDSLFVRPAACHYYFGDYYGPRYAALGFESCFVYGRRRYEPIIAYQRWEYRNNPAWLDSQIGLYHDRSAGRAPVPPRTLVQQTTVINNVTNVTNIRNVNVTNVQKTTVIAPTKTVLAARGQSSVPLDQAARHQVQATSSAAHQALAVERRKVEAPTTHAVPPARPRPVTLNAAARAPAAAVAPTATPKAGVPSSRPPAAAVLPSTQVPAPAQPTNAVPPKASATPHTATPAHPPATPAPPTNAVPPNASATRAQPSATPAPPTNAVLPKASATPAHPSATPVPPTNAVPPKASAPPHAASPAHPSPTPAHAQPITAPRPTGGAAPPPAPPPPPPPGKVPASSPPPGHPAATPSAKPAASPPAGKAPSTIPASPPPAAKGPSSPPAAPAGGAARPKPKEPAPKAPPPPPSNSTRAAPAAIHHASAAATPPAHGAALHTRPVRTEPPALAHRPGSDRAS